METHPTNVDDQERLAAFMVFATVDVLYSVIFLQSKA